MSALVAVLRHELRMAIRTPTTWVVCGALATAVAYAAWNGSRWVEAQQGMIATLEASDLTLYDSIYAQLEELERAAPRPHLQFAGMAWYIFQPEGALAPAPHIDPRRPEAAASEWVGARHVALPPSPLGALAIGHSDLHPFYTRVTIRTRPVLVQSDEIENPINLLNGRFDLAFVLTFCWPLLVLPLLYGALSDERDGGTLALLASQPIRLRTITAARLAVRGGLAVAVTLVTSVVALLARGSTSQLPIAGLALWIAAVIATGVFWCGVAGAVNLSRWRSAMNAVALTACWLASVVIAPSAIEEIASTIAPVPSRVELVNAIRDVGNFTPEQVTALMSTYYEEHPDASPTMESADTTAMRGLAQQDMIDRRIDPILAAYREAYRRQQALVDRLRVISPPLLIHDAVLDLAGTSITRFRRFNDQVDAYHREWRTYFYPLVHAHATMTRTLYENAPRFTFSEEPTSRTARRVLGLVGFTALVGAILLVIVLRRVERTAIR
jgi:ABC-2 type transport system permease protein